jgi:hypothetical protein
MSAYTQRRLAELLNQSAIDDDIMDYISGGDSKPVDIHNKDFNPNLKKNWPALQQAFYEKLQRDYQNEIIQLIEMIHALEEQLRLTNQQDLLQ